MAVRFSLRSLFLIAAIIALVCGYIPWRRGQVYREVWELKDLGVAFSDPVGLLGVPQRADILVGMGYGRPNEQQIRMLEQRIRAIGVSEIQISRAEDFQEDIWNDKGPPHPPAGGAKLSERPRIGSYSRGYMW